MLCRSPQGPVPEHPLPVVCIHGLARNARDFDALAATVAAAGRRVVAVDVVGRGDSEWLRDPLASVYPQYVSDMATLIARLVCAQVDLVGISMGGLICLLLAAQPGTQLRSLALNDVGHFIPTAALARILEYLGKAPHFARHHLAG